MNFQNLNSKITIISLLIVFLSIFLFIGNIKIKAQNNIIELKGWGWIGADCTDPSEIVCGATTSPIGWISLNSNNPEIECHDFPYAVKINLSSGDLLGKAWIGVGESTITCITNENSIGYIDFDSTDVPQDCNEDCYPAKMTNNIISGWAPIISKDYQNNPIILTWVKFKGNNYQTEYNPQENILLGFAWSGLGKDQGFGWIHFSPNVQPQPPQIQQSPNFDLAIDSLDIRTFICKNNQFDTSLINEYLNNPDVVIPSTTYATQFYNEVAKNTCPETQRNRPVEFEAKGICKSGNCPAFKLVIEIRPKSTLGLAPEDIEKRTFETAYNNQYPKTLKATYFVDKPYDYLVIAKFVDQNNNVIQNDNDNTNNEKSQTLKVFDYLCVFGFCSQAQYDPQDPTDILSDLKYKIINTFEKSDSPCRFYRNEICKAQIGF